MVGQRTLFPILFFHLLTPPAHTNHSVLKENPYLSTHPIPNIRLQYNTILHYTIFFQVMCGRLSCPKQMVGEKKKKSLIVIGWEDPLHSCIGYLRINQLRVFAIYVFIFEVTTVTSFKASSTSCRPIRCAPRLGSSTGLNFGCGCALSSPDREILLCGVDM